jgi:hypothetical protein
MTYHGLPQHQGTYRAHTAPHRVHPAMDRLRTSSVDGGAEVARASGAWLIHIHPDRGHAAEAESHGRRDDAGGHARPADVRESA